MSRKNERKKEKESLFEEGYAARYADKSYYTNPHKHMDLQHWADGWSYADNEINNEEVSEPYWLCCGSKVLTKHRDGCCEAKMGNTHHCRWGTAEEHSAWQTHNNKVTDREMIVFLMDEIDLASDWLVNGETHMATGVLGRCHAEIRKHLSKG